MKKYVRIASFALILLLCVSLILPSCGKGERLEVVSDDFPRMKSLKAGEYDGVSFYEYYRDVMEDRASYKHAYMVSEENNVLKISEGIDTVWQPTTQHVKCNSGGYFVALNLGEHESWVQYYNVLRKGHTSDPPENQFVTNYNPLKFVRIDDENMYLITYTLLSDGIVTDYHTVIYKLYQPDPNSDWMWQEMPEAIRGIPLDAYYHEESELLYVVTEYGISTVNEDGSIFSYENSYKEITVWDSDDHYEVYEGWYYSLPTSIVRINDMIYVGSYFGIYAQPVDGSASTWYPLSPN